MKLNKELKVKIPLLKSMKRFYLKKFLLIYVNNEAAARQHKSYVPPGSGTELKSSEREYNILINHWISSFSLAVSTKVSVIPNHSIIKQNPLSGIQANTD